MAVATSRIQRAFEMLSQRPGFVERSDQQQLAFLISDCIEGGRSGAYEAPTGLGKSLAALIPAVANAIESGKRTVVSTYTNVLAEQYWRKDLPLALSLFDDPCPTAFLIGKQRYVCLSALAEASASTFLQVKEHAELGIETEFRNIVKKGARELNALWEQVSVPAVCPSRLCPLYNECFYYGARRQVEQAKVVITNHSVVLQDALLRQASENELSILGKMDLLILDEAHDFAEAAVNALEYEISDTKLNLMIGLANRMEQALLPIATQAREAHEWTSDVESFRQRLLRAKRDLAALGGVVGRSGIFGATPEPIWKHPEVTRHAIGDPTEIERFADMLGAECSEFVTLADKALFRWRNAEGTSSETADLARDTIRNYTMYLREFADQCAFLAKRLSHDGDVAVSYLGGESLPMVRRATVGLDGPLQSMLWTKVPTVSLSATLALEGNFEYFKRTTGASPEFEEVLPSPFDFGSQASLYLPPLGRIPDPASARATGQEGAYYAAIAKELREIIETVGGRTLALFHSRREMEAVYELIEPMEDYPIILQRKSGVATTGERFKQEVRTSLFGLRSFWTGFDAPGETLSCLVIVRIPFEVPVDPPAVARNAWIQSKGGNPFLDHSLPQAKLIVRQGVGRLIRSTEDQGVMAILDPRIHTKNYGQEFIANLPPGLRIYNDIGDAAGAVGL